MDKSISRGDKLKRVNKVLKEFNLEKCANVKIGIPGKVKGISGGEMRRLSVASEVCKIYLFFLSKKAIINYFFFLEIHINVL